MQAVVLAGGLGTRLRSAVPDLPKPMAPVAGRPFLAWILDPLVDAGFERVVLAVGYRHEVIRDVFGASYRGMPLRYSVEDRPLGTGGAIRRAADQVDESPVFVLNGDTRLDLDYPAMGSAHARAGATMTMAVCQVPDAARYGALELQGDRVRGFVAKGRAGPGLINAGTYLLSAALLQTIPAGRPFSFEQELLMPRVGEIRPLAFVAAGLFIDIGVPEDYTRAQALFAQRVPHRQRDSA
jgi:D-glycero-alpha-D-manno-heptose 1-phosphate guanylyltransferase